ncbi:MAG: mucoidy inhibitor MuiA family protein [Candidatus Hodarchaeales archaeon]
MINANTKVTEVTVYPNKALTKREGEIKVLPGKNEVTISNLPLTIHTDSIRVKGSSITGTIIEGIDVERISHTTHYEPDKKIIDKLTALREDLRKLNAEKEFISIRIKNNSELEKKFAADFPRYYSRGNVNLEAFNNLRKQLEEEYMSLKQRIIQIDREKEKVEREIEILEQEIEEKNISLKPDFYTVIVYLNNPSHAEDVFNLQLSYIVTNASWYPMYDFRYEPSEKKVTIDYFGMVKQSSSEDWDNIDLILSTASPTVITTIPELRPWNIDIEHFIPDSVPPMVKAKKRAMKPMAFSKKDMSLDALAGAIPAPVPAARVQAVIEDTGEVQIFRIPKKENIPSQDKPKQVLISQIVNPVDTIFIAVPIKTPEVIQQGEMTNESELILLPGKVNLFYKNEFLGKTRIRQIAPTEKFKFVLGTTGKIKIKRKVSSEEVSKKGMISKTRVRKFEIEIKITNNRKEKSTLIVKDRLPISKHEDIKVKILELSPKPFKRDKQNICEWTVNLEPQEKFTIVQSFEVEAPVDETIVGI